MDRFEARKAVVAKLEEIGALVKIEKRVHSVGHSERTGVVVEPRLSTQWFVKMDQLAKNAIANQDTEDKVEILPATFQRYFPPMDGKCPRLGNLSSALVGSPNPCLVQC